MNRYAVALLDGLNNSNRLIRQGMKVPAHTLEFGLHNLSISPAAIVDLHPLLSQISRHSIYD